MYLVFPVHIPAISLSFCLSDADVTHVKNDDDEMQQEKFIIATKKLVLQSA